MKLHLPKVLLTAVIAASASFSQVMGAEYVATKGSSNYFHSCTITPTDSNVTPEYSGTNAWKNFSNVDKKERDHTLKFAADTLTSDIYYTIQYGDFNAGAIVVEAGSHVKGINWDNADDPSTSDKKRTFQIGKDDGTYTSTFNRSFDIIPGQALNLKGTQTWNIAAQQIVTLQAETVTNHGAITLSGGSVEVSGSLVNNDTLTVGCELKLDRAITNNGTINVNTNGKFVISSLSGFEYTTADDSAVTDNGIVSLGNAYTIWQGGTSTGSTAKVTYSNEEYEIVDGKAIIGAREVFLVAKDTVYVGGTTPTEGTKDATSFFVREDATMELGAREQGAALTTGQVICATEGTGTINVKANATLDNGTATPFKGTLKINSGATLYLGSSSEKDATDAWTADVSSLAGFELAGGKLQFRGGSISLGNIKVTADNSTLSLFDQKSTTDYKISIGTLTLDAKLDLLSKWKSNTAIEKLTGSGDLTWGEAHTEANNHRYVHIKSMEGYTGTLTFVGNTNNTQELKLGNGLFGSAFSTGKIVMGANTNLVLNGQSGAASATEASGAQQVTSLELGDNTNVKSQDGSYNYTKLTLATGATATLQHQWNKYQFIGALIGKDAELVLKRTGGGSAGNGGVFILDGAGDTNYSGVINLQNAANDNQSGLIVKNDTTGTKLADTVVKFTGDANKSMLAFVSRGYTVQNGAAVPTPAADKVCDGTIAGLSGDKGNVYAATLTVDVAESEEYTYGGGLSVSSLKKAGAGTQNISTDMSAYTGAVKVSGGKLALTNAAEGANTTLTSLTLDGGALEVTGSLTLNALSVDFSKYSTDDSHTLVSSGSTLTLNGVDLQAITGVNGDYIANVEQVNESLVLFYLPATVTTEVESYTLDATGTALTLNVKEAVLREGMQVNVHLITDAMMRDILQEMQAKGAIKDGSNPIVSITLAGSESGYIYADTMDEVVFVKGKTGQNYWGEMVGSQLMYNVERIPEPTTATLSLLALMGLAARRRRK